MALWCVSCSGSTTNPMPIIWSGVEQSTKEPSMTIRKRWKVLTAALFQQWHEKRCAECGTTWMAVGPQTDLIAICDACEVAEMERFAEAVERRFQHEMKGAI